MLVLNNRSKVSDNFRGYEYFASGEDVHQAEISDALITKLQQFREVWNSGIKITSGFRTLEHPIEKKKSKPGQHASGTAVDIAIIGGGAAFYAAVKCALEIGFNGIGISRKDSFLHLDVRNTTPVLWTY